MHWQRVLIAGIIASLGVARGHHNPSVIWVEQRFPNGELHSSRRYVNDIKDGEQLGFWPNGRARFRYVAVDGAPSGAYESWHRNGQLGSLQHFEAGRELGSQQTWSRTGTLLSNYVVKDGRRYGLFDSKPCFTVDEGGLE
jgi:antitoxin component YwqK of YwqJK toxin-antitoxin module